ncbi:MAG: (2Fe-2S)-binding protein [Deltaproteobacteria bacterium]|jgi:bacterioferritin-associated ferredoxin|nr:(2Fe-2S)-binding protein [Deltaproteobacteria bacterium]
MLVCHCHDVSDREIRRAVREGASSRRQVTRQCRAGGDCGGCRQVIEEVLSDEDRESQGAYALGLELSPAR